MNIVDLMKKNIGLLITGIVGIIAGAMFFGQGDAGISELKNNFNSRIQTVDDKLKALSGANSKIGDIEKKLSSLAEVSMSKLAKLEKTSETLPKTVGDLTSELNTIGSNISAVKLSAGEQISAANKRIEALEKKLALLIGVQKKMTADVAAVRPNTKAAAMAAAPEDGVKLSIGQSAWLIDNKLNVTLAYIYPDNKHARVGMEGRLYELSTGAIEDFEFEGKRCGLEFVGVSDGKAVIKHRCDS